MNHETKVKLTALGLIALLVLMLSATIYGLTRKYHTIPGSGIIATGDLSSNPSALDWSGIYVSVPASRNTTLTNDGTSTVTNLNMTVINMVGLSNYTLTWNLEGTNLNPAQSVTATFELTIFNFTSLNFSFDMVIGYDY